MNIVDKSELYEQLLNQFKLNTITINDMEKTIYCENFAGLFIDTEGVINIGIVTDDNEINRLQTAYSYNGQVTYKTQAFSYNYLYKIKDSLTDIMVDYNVLQ